MEELKTYRLADICNSIQTGPFGSQLHKSDYVEFGTPIVMPKDITNGKINDNNISRISKNDVARLFKHKLVPGNIIYPRRGDISKCALITSKEDGWVCGTGCIKVDINQQIANSTYVMYVLCQSETVNWIESNAVGTTMLNLNTSILSDLPIKLPSLNTQKKLANIVSSFDKKIALNRRINDNLEQQAQALFKSWFVDFEPFKDGKFVETEMGMIPEGWKVVQLGEIIEISKRIINPQKNPDKIFYHYSLPACDNGLIPEIQSGKDIMSNKIILQNNTILFSKLNPRIKRIWFACDVLNDSICSTEFIPYRAKNERESVYIYSIINSDSFYASVLGCVNGATGSHQRFHAEDTLGLLFPYKKDIVDKYIDLVKPILAEIHKLRIENKTLALTRDSLLPRLMSGELKVNDLNC